MNTNKVAVILILIGVLYLIITSLVDVSTIFTGGDEKENVTGMSIIDVSSDQISDYHIYLYDTSTRKISTIASNKAGLFNPAIYDNRVVYTSYENGNGDIYYYNIDTDSVKQITSDPYEQDLAKIYGDIIVWDDSRSGYVEGSRFLDKQDIYMYDLNSGIESAIIKTGVPDRSPDVYADIITCEVYLKGIHGNVYFYNMTSDELKEVTTGLNGHERVKIHENRLVWYTRYPSDIYTHDLSTGETTRVTNSSGRMLHPSIYGDFIVYPWASSGSKFDLYVHDLKTHSTIQITKTPDFSETLPDIHGRRIAFVRMYSLDDMDVIVYNLDTGEEITVGSPSEFNYGPEIYGNKVVWSAFDVSKEKKGLL